MRLTVSCTPRLSGLALAAALSHLACFPDSGHAAPRFTEWITGGSSRTRTWPTLIEIDHIDTPGIYQVVIVNTSGLSGEQGQILASGTIDTSLTLHTTLMTTSTASDWWVTLDTPAPLALDRVFSLPEFRIDRAITALLLRDTPELPPGYRISEAMLADQPWINRQVDALTILPADSASHMAITDCPILPLSSGFYAFRPSTDKGPPASDWQVHPLHADRESAMPTPGWPNQPPKATNPEPASAALLAGLGLLIRPRRPFPRENSRIRANIQVDPSIEQVSPERNTS